jgi:hypothetical protein
MKRIHSLLLDIMTLPGELLDDEGFAEYKKRYICPKCPEERRALRDVDGTGECWWYKNWSAGNYGIPRSFGFSNWLSQYIFWATDLDYFKKLHQESGLALVPEEIPEDD